MLFLAHSCLGYVTRYSVLEDGVETMADQLFLEDGGLDTS